MSRIADLAAVALAFTVALFLGVRSTAGLTYDPFASGPGPTVLYLLAASGIAAAVLGMRRIRRGGMRLAVRAAIYGVVAVLVSMMVWRVAMLRFDVPAWPPDLAEINSARLTPLQRAQWGSRVAVHALTSGESGGQIMIPRSWPFPRDGLVAVRRMPSGGVQVWTRVGRSVFCSSIPAIVHGEDDSDASMLYCGEESQPPGLRFARPVRGAIDAAAVESLVNGKPAGEPWTQYRHDGARSAATNPGTGGGGWRATVDGEMRASVSVVGDIVLAGAHGSGTLTALDLRSGRRLWEVRAPNWIHQDPITDGRIVVVGFGDNKGSFAGRSPSGVAAFAVATGDHLWTVFDESSVMTSPVLAGDEIVYGSAAGVVRKRQLHTGRLLAEGRLPGGVIMAPPAAVGDTVVFTLDPAAVCAIRLSDLARLWCSELPHVRMMGHAAPAVASHQVIASAAATLLAPTLREFIGLPWWLKKALVKRALYPYLFEEYAGQVFASFDLHDGRIRWKSALFADPRRVTGHISGTPAVAGRTGVVVLPIADTVVAFDVESGRVHWTAPGQKVRGPPLVMGNRVIIAGEGGITVRDLADGRVTCRLKRDIAYDRAGPALAGGLLIFADTKGGIEAVPADQLIREGCG